MNRAALNRSKFLLILIFFQVTFWTYPSAHAGLYTFTSHTFTACNATGASGPTQAACRSAYTTTWDENDLYYTVTSGIQLWTVPVSGTYTIRANGASGGKNSTYSSTGYGASIQGDFTLSSGEQLKILVGQQGVINSNTNYVPGGGGGSFVVKNSTLLIAAGGGGTHGTGGGSAGDLTMMRTCADASITTTGKTACMYAGTETPGAGGVNGNAGGTVTSSWNGYPGSGYLQDAAAGGAKSWANGMLGGPGNTYGTAGGFGGGGSGGMYGGSGGGGYSGGGADSRHAPGGGGGSYNSGTTKVETLTASFGDGSVLITLKAIAISDTTISISTPSNFEFRVAGDIVATASAPGRVTFIVNGKRAGGCVAIPTTTNAPYTATCSYKPSFRGAITISAELAPSDTSAYRSSKSANSVAQSIRRSGNR